MNILLIMDPGISVPPLKYGGIERVVYLLANAYAEQGHEVTLLAGPGSHCKGKTISFGINKTDCSKWYRLKAIAFVWLYLIKHSISHKHSTGSATSAKFDLIHNFGRLIYLLPVLHSASSKIMSYQRKITNRNTSMIQRFRPKNMWFTACSNNCRIESKIGNAHASRSEGITTFPARNNPWQTIYNTVDFSAYELSTDFNENAPLMFLGRLDPIKGAHTAIQVAKRSSSQLWIAGNVPQTEEGQAYYNDTISAQIDNSQVIYLGELDDRQKQHYLSRSKALLFPIEWEEPFGIVMIEAMACGTPVIAFNRGSVPEVITPGKTGFIVDDASSMSRAIQKLEVINRKLCRETAMAQFDIGTIAGKYLALAVQKS